MAAAAAQAQVLLVRNRAGSHPLVLQRSHRLTANHVFKAKTAMDKFINSVKLNPERRENADPYYLIHNAGELVFGTALVFHGFGQTPHQCQLLVNYLFQNGLNVYQPCLAGHYLKNPNQNWPQVDLKPQWKEKVRQNFLKDQVLAMGLDQISPENTMQRLLSLSPDMADAIDAINEGESSPDFHRFYDSNHLQYFREAEARLEEVQALPGPIFTMGISMGGAVALSLAITYPDTISKVVGYAPLLKTLDDGRRQFALAAGPLDVIDTGWDPELQFTMGCLAAIDLCGNYINRCNLSNLAKVPSFFLFTENEDSADLPTQEQFASRLESLAGSTHLHYKYERSLGVPHAMMHPSEVPISNKFWRTMYQETFRFLTTGHVQKDQLASLQQDPNLPQVNPVNA